jgi:hypothetical protein
MFPFIRDGKVFIPLRAEGPHGLIGDGVVELRPADPGYAEVKAWIEAESHQD